MQSSTEAIPDQRSTLTGPYIYHRSDSQEYTINGSPNHIQQAISALFMTTLHQKASRVILAWEEIVVVITRNGKDKLIAALSCPSPPVKSRVPNHPERSNWQHLLLNNDIGSSQSA